MGIVAVVLLTLLVPLSFVVTVHVVQRGFDLSGDQGGKTDPLFGSIFNFVGLIEFLALAAVALADRADHRAGTFSGGMKRRLNLGAALIHGPSLLLLD